MIEANGQAFVVREPAQLRQVIKGSWEVRLTFIDGREKTLRDFQLKDFKGDPDLETFGGVALYETSFTVDTTAGYEYLNLGSVAGISEVWLNGRNLGVRWYGEHSYPVKAVLKQGVNKLSVKLTTTLGNYMHSIPNNKDAKKWIIDRKQPLHSIGIIGPIYIGNWQ